MKIRKWHIPIAIICLISGILLALNLRAQEANLKNKTTSRNEYLVDKIKKQEAENKKLEQDIIKLKDQINAEQKSQTQDQSHLQQFQQSLETARVLSGLTDVQGPGLKITLSDSKNGQFLNGDPNSSLVHYDYILSIVVALRAAHADAIAVNGQRIVTTSDIECVGTVISVNRERFPPPYVITAIGNPERLEKAVQNADRYNDITKNELPVTLEKKSLLTIKAYKGTFSFPYTKIYKEGEK